MKNRGGYFVDNRLKERVKQVSADDALSIILTSGKCRK